MEKWSHESEKMVCLINRNRLCKCVKISSVWFCLNCIYIYRIYIQGWSKQKLTTRVFTCFFFFHPPFRESEHFNKYISFVLTYGSGWRNSKLIGCGNEEIVDCSNFSYNEDTLYFESWIRPNLCGCSLINFEVFILFCKILLV